MKKISISSTVVLTVALITLLNSTCLDARSSDKLDRPEAELSFSNTTRIDILDLSVAAVYPSTITVSGLTGTITHVQVLLRDVRHTYPNDMDIVLVGPTGARSIIMSDMGDGFAGVDGAEMLFDSVSGMALPLEGSGDGEILDGTYLPQNEGGLQDNFPNPGPGLLDSGEPADLGIFNGTNPNGDWHLYVVDDTGGDIGEISDGWRLIIRDDTFFEVTKTEDTNDGVCDADCSLREAIEAADANGNGYDEIRFDPDVFGSPRTIGLTSSLAGINSSLEISGPGADLLTIRRSSGAIFRVFEFEGSGSVTVRGLTISNGDAGSAKGGGIYSSNDLHLDGVHLENNRAESGGGVYIADTGTFVNSTFAGNTAAARGGGIYYRGDEDFGSPNSSLQLLNSTVSGNHAPWGSGIAADGFDPFSDLVVRSSTVANNTGGGDGIRTFSDTADQVVDVTLQNTILANNSGANINVINDGTGNAQVISEGHNLSSDDSSAWLTQGTDMIETDPLLGSLQYNGGPTPTHALPLNSPALNAGESAGNVLDQRSQPRPYSSPLATSDGSGAGNLGDGTDMGAVEMQYLQVTNADDSGAGSLRQALLDANSNGAGLDDIQFDPGFFRIPRTINLAGELPQIRSNLNVLGTGADRLTVRRDVGGDYGILNVGSGIEVSLSGFTVSNGNSSGLDGGGIVAFSYLVLTDMAISRNASSTFGGGVLALASIRIIRTTVSENFSTGNVAGIDFQPFVSGATLTISNSTISGNRGTGFASGGVGIAAFSGIQSFVEISSSTIAGNHTESSSRNGGLKIFAEEEGTTIDVSIRNTLLAENTNSNIIAFGISGGTVNFSSDGFNLSDDDGSGFLNHPGDQTEMQAKLAPLAYYGGPTRTHALMADSPAIDQGFSETIRRDQRGFPGPFDFPGIDTARAGNEADIGAVEMQGIVVENDNDTGAGSLRQALLDANANGLGHDDIVFAMPFFGGNRSIDLASALPVVRSGLAIVGAGARKLVVRRDSGPDFRIFEFLEGDRVSLSGLSIRDGLINFSAGIRSSVPLFLSGVSLTNNQGEFEGGGMLLTSDGYFEDCTIAGNSANAGAAISFNPVDGGRLRVEGCTISENSANVFAPAISAGAGNSATGDSIIVEVSGSTIVNNSGGSASIHMDVSNKAGIEASASFRNSIVDNATARNFSTFASAGSTATIVSLGHNVISDDGLGVFVEAGDQINIEPMLGPLANNGGPTDTHFPLAGSPVFDAGKCLDGKVHRDQRGYLRPFDLPDIPDASDGCDVGAVEWSDGNGDGADDGLVIFTNGFE